MKNITGQGTTKAEVGLFTDGLGIFNQASHVTEQFC